MRKSGLQAPACPRPPRQVQNASQQLADPCRVQRLAAKHNIPLDWDVADSKDDAEESRGSKSQADGGRILSDAETEQSTQTEADLPAQPLRAKAGSRRPAKRWGMQRL